MLHVSCDAANRALHVLNRVGAGQRPAQLGRQAETVDGEHLVEAFQDAAGHAGRFLLHTSGQIPDQALRFGRQKINLHQADMLFEPKAERPTMGSADLCFIVDTLDGAEQHLASCGVSILVARSPRTGTHGPITSIYIRDPDQNLIELSVYSKDKGTAV